MCWFTVPVTMQRSGKVLVAGVSTAVAMTVFGTGKSVSVVSALHGLGATGVAIDVVVVLNPAHWFCACPSTQSGPCGCVGAGEFATQFRLPPTLTRLTSDAPAGDTLWLSWTLPPIRPSQATHGPAFPLHSKLPWITTSGPRNPLGLKLLQELMMTFPPTSTWPLRRTDLQLAA